MSNSGVYLKINNKLKKLFKINIFIYDSIIFKSFIKSADIIRKAEANNRPLIEYAPSDSKLKKEQETHQIEWENLVTEILDRIK